MNKALTLMVLAMLGGCVGSEAGETDEVGAADVAGLGEIDPQRYYCALTYTYSYTHALTGEFRVLDALRIARNAKTQPDHCHETCVNLFNTVSRSRSDYTFQNEAYAPSWSTYYRRYHESHAGEDFAGCAVILGSELDALVVPERH